jgi:hypothetical protein
MFVGTDALAELLMTSSFDPLAERFDAGAVPA